MVHSKYTPLWDYIKQSDETEAILTFDDIQRILNFPIDHSFLNYKKELLEYGYQVAKISLKEKTVRFTKVAD